MNNLDEKSTQALKEIVSKYNILLASLSWAIDYTRNPELAESLQRKYDQAENELQDILFLLK